MDAKVSDHILSRIEELNSIGIALSSEKNTAILLEKILSGAKSISHADGGTLYRVTDDKELKIEIMMSDSKQIYMGGASGNSIPFGTIPLYNADGSPNNQMVVVNSVITGNTINIANTETAQGFDFSGTRAFDNKIGYRSISLLTVPMVNHQNDIIAVLQLINKLDPHGSQVTFFNEEDEQFARSLASQAAVTLTNKRLMDEQKQLFESFIRLIATAIDEKSPYMGGHCRRVPEITMALAKKVSHCGKHPFENFSLSEKDTYELEIASWLHDCGKITTPEHVVDKATKLEKKFDRIHYVEAKSEIIKRDTEITRLNQEIKLLESDSQSKCSNAHSEFQNIIKQIDDDMNFLRKCNLGAEFMSPEDQQRVKRIASKTWRSANGKVLPFLNEDEVNNLCISKGTLNDDERRIINQHINTTISMLNALPFPKHLRNVPEYAGGHHERMDGKGYPKGLTREQMSVQARIMAIADIFEALTAKDRPYKKAKPLSETLSILGKMKLDSHIDPDLFDIFIENKVYKSYAEKYLDSEQIDIEEPWEIPGYPFQM